MKKLFIVVVFVAILGGAYLYLQNNKNDNIEESQVALPDSWETYEYENWSIQHPREFQTKKVAGQVIFKNSSTGELFSVISKNVNTMPEKELFKSIQDSNKTDPLTTLLMIQKIGVENTPKDEQPTILIEKIVTINGLKAAQFGTKDIDGSYMLRTSFEQNGNIIDLAVFPKSLDTNDSTLQTYFTILKTFEFKN